MPVSQSVHWYREKYSCFEFHKEIPISKYNSGIAVIQPVLPDLWPARFGRRHIAENFVRLSAIGSGWIDPPKKTGFSIT
jgi:hypothetical protein